MPCLRYPMPNITPRWLTLQHIKHPPQRLAHKVCHNRRDILQTQTKNALMVQLNPLTHSELKVFGVWGVFSKIPQ